MAKASKKKTGADAKMIEKEPEVREEQPTGPAPNADPGTINVGDIGSAAQYIDLAFRRGAFQASEAAAVGTLYNKLAAFVSVYNEHMKEQAEAMKKASEEGVDTDAEKEGE